MFFKKDFSNQQRAQAKLLDLSKRSLSLTHKGTANDTRTKKIMETTANDTRTDS